MLCFDLFCLLKIGYTQFQYKDTNYIRLYFCPKFYQDGAIFKDKNELEQLYKDANQNEYKEFEEITKETELDLKNHNLIIKLFTAGYGYDSKIQYRVENHKAYFRIKNEGSGMSLGSTAIAIDKDYEITDWEFFSYDDEQLAILINLVCIVLKCIFILLSIKKINTDRKVSKIRVGSLE